MDRRGGAAGALASGGEVAVFDWGLVAVTLAYVGLLFVVATYGDRRAAAGRSAIGNPVVYSLSIAVYCTAWTFYGSVGRAASSGLEFLPIYLGPTLTAILWWMILRKMIRISRASRLTSLADFVAARYGAGTFLGALVATVLVVGVTPYIALQLRAVSVSFTILSAPDGVAAAPDPGGTALWAAGILAVFAILFGTRHLDPAEHHEGLVLAVAFESVVKLVAFLVVGVFVVYGMFDGLGDLFGRAYRVPELRELLVFGEGQRYGSWFALTGVSMLAILFLPRQFQMMVVENTDERHLRSASWLFPSYLIAINFFVLPIALAGRLHFADGSVDSDIFVLALPLSTGHEAIAWIAFLGGFSAATGMVIVATVALSTMVSNNLLLPLLLRLGLLQATGGRSAHRPQSAGPQHPPSDDRPPAGARLRVPAPHR